MTINVITSILNTINISKLVITFIILVMSGCAIPDKNIVSEKPNIIYINVDDMGWKDTGAYGSKFYETPNIDKLASEGMLFTQAYAAAANCAPSRACLLSGQYSPRHGIYTVSNSDRGNTKTRKLIPTKNTTILADSILTIAEVLKNNGYKTITIGKWHLGDDPKTQGFDINIAGTRAGSPKSYFSPYKNRNLKNGLEGEHLTDRLTTEAINIIESHKDSTFFLYLPYFAIHTPLQGKEDLIEKYKLKGGDSLQQHATYAAMIETLDTNIGRLLSTVNTLGLRSKTIIVFTSDNGGICANSSQYPLRAGKGSYYEGGVREPMIISWKGEIEEGSTSHIPISNIDIYPTLIDIVGIERSQDKILDGVSITPLLFQKGDLPQRTLFWHFPIYLQAYSKTKDDARDPLFRTRPGSTLLQGDWKLHQYFEDGGIELYNLKEDLGERNNLADSEPEKAKELLSILNTWRTDINAPIPTQLNPKYIH